MKLVKITASWCMSCILMNEVLKDVEKKYNINYDSINYDYDLNSDDINNYNVDKILPVYIKLDDNDKEVGRLVGEHSKKELIEFLNKDGYIYE